MAAPILRRTLISFSSDTSFSLLRKFHTSFSLHFSTKPPPSEPHAFTRFLIENHRFSPDAAADIASKTRLKSQSNADSILSFLTHTGFSAAQSQRSAQFSPQLLSANLDATIKPKFDLLGDLGFTSDEIVAIVSTQPAILNYSVSRISFSITTLKSMLGSTAAVTRFITTAGLFVRNIETTLLPNVELLKSCGLPMKQIIRQMMRFPRLFLLKPENVREFIDKAERMGSDRKSRSFIDAVEVVSSMTDETLGVKKKFLRDLGFSDEDVMMAFKNSPKVFALSVEKMRRVVEVLEGSGKYDMRSIVTSPVVFTYSTEKRIMPRLRVLEENKLIGNWPSLTTMVCITNGAFFERFVKANLDHVGEMWSVVCGEESI